MNDTMMTICGNVVDEPRKRTTTGGHEVVNFRVASTPRRFDRQQGCFVDNPTLFVTVSAWRQLGRNVLDSLHKGQSVVVTGRFTMRQWTANEQPRSAYDLEAVAVGHDLARGTTQFTRVYASAQVVTVDHDAAGLPRDDSDSYYDALESEAQVEADLSDVSTAETSLDLAGVGAGAEDDLRRPALAAS